MRFTFDKFSLRYTLKCTFFLKHILYAHLLGILHRFPFMQRIKFTHAAPFAYLCV